MEYRADPDDTNRPDGAPWGFRAFGALRTGPGPGMQRERKIVSGPAPDALCGAIPHRTPDEG